MMLIFVTFILYYNRERATNRMTEHGRPYSLEPGMIKDNHNQCNNVASFMKLLLLQYTCMQFKIFKIQQFWEIAYNLKTS